MKRHYFAKETVQSSAMDCGPAALKCILEGYGIPISFGRLREACQTGLDGTSINALEQVTNQLGLKAEQMMLPNDHLLQAEAQLLPAIVVTERPGGGTHFVVIWRQHGPYLQIMDPAVGRRWIRRETLLETLYEHRQPMRAQDWFAWASNSRAFVFPLIQRLQQIGFAKDIAEVLTVKTLKQGDWYALATLDAATRAVAGFKKSGYFRSKKQTTALLEELIAGDPNLIPKPYWSVLPYEEEPSDEPLVLMCGAVFIQIGEPDQPTAENLDDSELPDPIKAALREPPANAAKALANLIFKENHGLLLVLAMLLLIQSGGVVLEAILLRGFMEIGQALQLPELRLGAGLALVAFAVSMLLVQYPIVRSVLTLGRKLETRLRLALLRKIPKVSDRYFHGRLTGDLAERNHAIHYIRQLPNLVQDLLAASITLLAITASLIWIAPGFAHWILLTSMATVVIPLSLFPLMAERDMKVRAQEAALSRFYLDSLQGATPIHAHGAANAMRNEHERQLTDWTRASYELLNAGALMRLQQFIGLAMTWFIVWRYHDSNPQSGSILLLVYWLLQLPTLGEQIAGLIQQYPIQRNLTLRLIELLTIPEEEDPHQSYHAHQTPLHIQMQNLSLHSGRHAILQDINLNINPGEHIAIVGASGAGKSTLVGLLLGWNQPSQGSLLINGNPLDAAQRTALRRATAWLDPSVTLWNRNLLDNLNYGNPRDQRHPQFDSILEQAQLLEIVAQQPKGFQSMIGDNGSLLSGGEGMRVRFGRALLKPNAKLAILDEAFRGLDSKTRRTMLQDARSHWSESTLLYISHDQDSALNFDRVIVMQNGQIVQDGNPRELAQSEGAFRNLLQAEQAVRENLWKHSNWRHLHQDQGQIEEQQS
jgi:ATP-binding cassette subfamily B protein